jgi:hypothetical protein
MQRRHDALFVSHAWGLLIENRRAQDAIEDLQAGHHLCRLGTLRT